MYPCSWVGETYFFLTSFKTLFSVFLQFHTASFGVLFCFIFYISPSLSLSVLVLLLSCRFEKKKNYTMCEFSFIWGQMRTAAQETAPQIALRNCFTEAEGKVRMYVILVQGNTCSQVHIFLEDFY